MYSKLLLSAILIASFLAVWAYPQIPAPKTRQETESNADLIHFGDLIDIDVVGSLDYDWRGTLNPEGFLDGMDKLAEPVYALCQSEANLAAAVAKKYGAVLRDPVVVVKIIDRSNRAVAYVQGAVRYPYRFRIRRPVRLNELIVLSGGITDNSSGEIQIFRPGSLNCEKNGSAAGRDEKQGQNISIKITDLLAGDGAANPAVLSGDIVTVVAAAPVFLIGGLNVPKQFALRDKTTLSRAIAIAGGISKDGIEERIRIFRREGKGSTVILANLDKIRKKEAEDPILQPYDVIEVEQKGRGPSRTSPLSEEQPRLSRISALPLRIVD